ncbi:MAG: DUF2065 domain-containing protein [Gammaproteobacteria bacterium]|nr:DUF2065 domain-containing protein [Gammaproteobacteria bacterium]
MSITWEYVLTAMALVFIFEGIMPALAPGRYRKMMASALSQPDSVLQVIGLISISLGVVVIFWLH